jgi:hypothetical protein
MNFHLRHIIEENNRKERRKGTRGRMSKHLFYEFKETKRYWNLKEEESDRTFWRIHFAVGYGPVLKQTMW